MTEPAHLRPAHHRVIGWSLIGAVTLGVVFALCWTTAAYGKIEVTRSIVQYISDEPPGSTAALFVGLASVAALGACLGALIAVSHALISTTGRK